MDLELPDEHTTQSRDEKYHQIMEETIQGLTELIEVAIHVILHMRGVYPSEMFVRRKYRGVPVFQARHPAINEYISGAIKSVREELVQGGIDKIIVVISDKDETALERYIFAIQSMIDFESYGKDDSILGASSLDLFGQHLHSFLIKLNMMESQLRPIHIEGDASFAIFLELIDNEAPMTAQDSSNPLWLPARSHLTPKEFEMAELHVIRTVETGILNLLLIIEESSDKLRDKM